MKRIFLLLSIVLLTSCGDSKNSPEFMAAVSGNYLFNSDESIGISFKENRLQIRWRGKTNVDYLKVNDSTYYIQEMDERLIFKRQPTVYILLAPKKAHKGKEYRFEKMEAGTKTPHEHLLNNDFDKALAGYLAIQQKDSLDNTIDEWTLNKLAYKMVRKHRLKQAIALFKINTQLYPQSSNVFDSLGDGYWQLKDTAQAIKNYKKALAINPENRSARRFMKHHKFNSMQ